MNQKITTSLLIAFLMISVSSCNNYTSMTQATKISQLKGNPFMYNVSKSVISNLKQHAKSSGLDVSNLTLLTPVSSIFTTDNQLGGFKEMLMKNYHIPTLKMNKGFSSIVTIKDLIRFIATNGRGFNFYSN
ncbi:MAG TPA: hypothetical protein PKA54_00635 [Chitinophagaceae bacterium]|nr:MAG: hypothetical protein UZ11_BCD004001552 [Bacteroidetes bacterium OLB11]HMN31857.1 hypothetical protein [Chitinophagaceae bacterium]